MCLKSFSFFALVKKGWCTLHTRCIQKEQHIEKCRAVPFMFIRIMYSLCVVQMCMCLMYAKMKHMNSVSVTTLFYEKGKQQNTTQKWEKGSSFLHFVSSPLEMLAHDSG